jgi:hypothetical protein
MGRATVSVVFAGFVQAERAVDGEPDLGGVFVLLAVVFPPANGAKPKRSNSLQRLITATRTSKTKL